MNQLIIGSNVYEFDDSQFGSGSLTSENSLIEDSLTIDELVVTVLGIPGGQSVTGLEDVEFGTPVYYYRNQVLAGKFYKNKITRKSKYQYQIEAISGIGLLDRLMHYGDVYSAIEARALIMDIMDATLVSSTDTTETYSGIVDYVLEKVVGNQTINGWLAIQTRKEALQQVLFSLGASIFKQPNGVIEIKFSQPSSVKTLSPSNIYMGGSREYDSPVTAVNVTEHSFLPTDLDVEVELFNTDDYVTNELIVFSKPCHDLMWNGSSLTTNCGANHAYVTGSGTLTGKEYKDSTRIVREVIDSEADTPNELSITDATLVSSANSSNVAKRVANYYGNKQVILHSFVWDDVRPGEIVSVPDPFDETTSLTAYVQKLNLTFSNTVKAQSTLITNWSPKYIGNKYNNYVYLTEENEVFHPDAAHIGTTAKFIIFGGFTGGTGGSGSTNATGGSQLPLPAQSTNSIGDGTDGEPGAGGLGGIGVMKNEFEITLTDRDYKLTQIGAGGAGGAGGAAGMPGTTGLIGGETIFAGYSSNNGVLMTSGFANPIHPDDVFGARGITGCNGGAVGENLTYMGETYYCGYKASDNNWGVSGVDSEGRAISISGTSRGSRGSGACYGRNGTNGNRTYEYVWGGADGVNGTTPNNASAPTGIGKNGSGGHGAGAPSAGAGASGHNGFWEVEIATVVAQGDGGLGAAGSAGSSGSDGFVLILYA